MRASSMEERDFSYVKREFGSGDKFRMMTRKGIFPYSLLDSVDKLNPELKSSFPAPSLFANKLTDEEVTNE